VNTGVVRVDSERTWVFRSGVEKETRRRKPKQAKCKCRAMMDPNGEIGDETEHALYCGVVSSCAAKKKNAS
jgi:hypothetical protein